MEEDKKKDKKDKKDKEKKDKKEKDKDAYFGIIPKKEVGKFIENLKAALGKFKKEDDKKQGHFEIRGTKEDPKGFSLESFSVKPENFATYIDMNQEYMKNALAVNSIGFGLKSKDSQKVVEELLKKVMPIIQETEGYKKHPNKYQFHLRFTDNRAFLDIVQMEGKFLQPLLDLNVNSTEYHNFKVSAKSEFKPEGFFKVSQDEFALSTLQLVIKMEGQASNMKYITSCIAEALGKVKLTKKEHTAKLAKALSYIGFLKSFKTSKLCFEYDAKELCETGKELKKGNEDIVNKKFEEMRAKAKERGMKAKAVLEKIGGINDAKEIDVDHVILCSCIPKYKNGIATILDVPGLTKAINETILQ